MRKAGDVYRFRDSFGKLFELSFRIEVEEKAEDVDIVVSACAFAAIVAVRLFVVSHACAVFTRTVTASGVGANITVFGFLKVSSFELLRRDRINFREEFVKTCAQVGIAHKKSSLSWLSMLTTIPKEAILFKKIDSITSLCGRLYRQKYYTKKACNQQAFLV